MNTVFIIGAGYVAGKAASLLLDRGLQLSLGKRHPNRGVADDVAGRAKVYAMDVQDHLTYPRELLEAQTIIYCVASDGFSPEQYRSAYLNGLTKVLDALRARRQETQAAPPLQRLIFVSSTGVFAQNDGSTVDEHSPAEPQAFSGQIMLEAEIALRAFANSAPGFEACAIRFSGIYGPGRTRLIQEVVAGKPVSSTRWHQLTNRIHRDDCAAALVHLVTQEKIQECYVASDTYPATFGEIATWLAARLDVPIPAIHDEPINVGIVTTKASGGLERGGHKKCWSTGLLAEGFKFRFPSFREGYDSLIRSDTR
jgi:nucleoside-diphosphate-sugar epimerase